MTSSPNDFGLPTVVLSGHLSEIALRRALDGARLPPEPGPVVFDCRPMTGYDLEARHAFVAWQRANTRRITRVAILTDNRVWWMVIGAMSLASGNPMRGFDSVGKALAWARAR